MTHIAITPTATATFSGEPTPKEIEALQEVAEWFCGAIEAFLIRHQQDIPPKHRAKLREMAAKAIRNESEVIRPDYCPSDLRDQFRRIVVEEAYRYRCRVNNEEFDAQGKYMLLDGSVYHKPVKQVFY